MASLQPITALQPIIRKLDLMRMVAGMLIVVDGYPLIFFFKETLRLAPGSTAFTAAFLAMGFILMVPTTVFQKLYRPNTGLLKLAVQFLALVIFYMIFFPDQFFKEMDIDSMYYLFIFLYLFLLINIPNEIIEVFIPVVIAFTVVSNLALVYSMIVDPTWTVGQRAAINFGPEEERMGNPHVFARNAFMCVVACGIWGFRAETGLIPRLLTLGSCVFSMGILVMTQTRSSIVALIIAIGLFVFYNARPAQLKAAVRGLMQPTSLLLLAILFGGLLYMIRSNSEVIAIIYGYVLAFVERNLENVYALVGFKVQNTYAASFDASAANRATSVGYLQNVLAGSLHILFLGQGYKSMYLDVPLLEALINHGMLGFAMFASFCFAVLIYSLRAMQNNPDPLSTFLAYFSVLLFVQLFTNGRPYEISFWHPFCLMIRFMGISHLFPAYLRNKPVTAVAS